MREAGGASFFSRCRNFCNTDSSPSRWIATPSSPFNTHPAKSNSRATRYTKGRNPTPCTTPQNIEGEIEHAIAHDTDFHQFMLYTPVPGTPLFFEMKEQGRMQIGRASCRERV